MNRHISFRKTKSQERISYYLRALTIVLIALAMAIPTVSNRNSVLVNGSNQAGPNPDSLTAVSTTTEPQASIQETTDPTVSASIVQANATATSASSHKAIEIKNFEQVKSIPNNSTMARGGLAPAATVQPMNSFSNIGYDSNKVNLPRYSLKEAAYWSLLSYSRLRFDVYMPSGKTQWYSLFINLQSQDDPYSRTFRVFLNGNQRYSTIISPPGFSTTLSAGTMLWITGTQTVELEIQWGFYSQTGWKLLELYPINNEFPSIQNPDPSRIRDWTGEWFPKTDSVSPLTWQAKLGTDSKVDVNIQQGSDPYTRCLRVYVDGTMKTGECDYVVPGHFVISLGNYAQGVHWLKLEIKWGFYTEFGWKIDLSNFRVDYAAMSVQADYMPGMAPIQDALNYIQTYYSDHGPERVTFFVTNQVAETRFLTANAYFNNYVNANPSTYLHNGDTRWNYVIFGEYASDDGTSANNALGFSFGGGTPGQTSPFFFIAVQQIRDCIGNFFCSLWPASETAAQKSITMHEFGHDVGMIHNPSWLNSDMYAVAVNGQSVRDSPVYAIGDWVNRVFP